MSMAEALELMEGYDKEKEYVVAKHAAALAQRAKGRKLAGEIPDSTGEQNGTMQVWEVSPEAMDEALDEMLGNQDPKSTVVTLGEEIKQTEELVVSSVAKPSIAKRITNKLKGNK